MEIKVKVIEGLCTGCEEKTEQEIITREQIINVKNEPIKVRVRYLRCTQCGDEVYDTTGQDPFDLAYRKYREIHNLLQPEQIKEMREKCGLTQAELARLLGLGVATISRYENGSLQDAAHDNLIKLAMDPLNFTELLEKYKNLFSDKRHKALQCRLTEADRELYPFEKYYEHWLKDYEPCDTNGYKKLDRDRLYEAVLFLCADGVWKTKLNKLLFYLDFKHFKEFTRSFSGVEYVHLQYGPVPDKYELHYTWMKLKREIELEERFSSTGDLCEMIRSLRAPNLNIFGSDELYTLTFIKKHFEKYSAKQITELSHQESAYLETLPGELISYRHAAQLSI